MIRIANGQGFWGDSLEAPLQQLRDGPLDYLTLDYLAEVTMSILQKQRSRDPRTGYARDFIDVIARGAREIVERGVKVVANAGGVNPEACRDAAAAALDRAGYGGRLKIGVVAGDDIMTRLDEFIDRGLDLKNLDTGEPLSAIRSRVQSANVYFGAFPIADALCRGAHRYRPDSCSQPPERVQHSYCSGAALYRNNIVQGSTQVCIVKAAEQPESGNCEQQHWHSCRCPREH